MVEENRIPSPRRKWWWLIGAVLVFAVAFDLLERLARPRAGRAADGSAQAVAASSPETPEVRRLDGGGVEIRLDFFRRTTIRLGDEEEEAALFDCLEEGIEQAFADGTEGWSGHRVREEVRRIQERCLGVLPDLPTVPITPPAPPGG